MQTSDYAIKQLREIVSSFGRCTNIGPAYAPCECYSVGIIVIRHQVSLIADNHKNYLFITNYIHFFNPRLHLPLSTAHEKNYHRKCIWK